ncbi:hypothetical protein [Streptomyces sp. MJP52]|uniref:hypothetical protein n=1 Tax=Streptomyces sp. MJP52 TaxID=2940555 RepID=UPI0024760974|nr:hypothetical protein [Streptomyces sp. MJP52]MDH6227369.1 hypothetical protein [Streptomyces sp. MJP52]
MMILISPSYGSPETRRHWADTIDRLVDFATSPRRDALTDQQFEKLITLHPEGNARFWGASPHHDARFADVTTGHIVLFTGQNRVRAVGEVGAVFRNKEFADLLWPPGNGPSWHTVYSVLNVISVDIPYTDLNDTLGYKPSFTYPGQMFIRDERVQAVLDDFLITPGTVNTWHTVARSGKQAGEELASPQETTLAEHQRALPSSRRAPAEEMHNPANRLPAHPPTSRGRTSGG